MLVSRGPAMLLSALLALPVTSGVQPRSHLEVSRTSFVAADGTPFEWRGITAFRLVEFVARGKRRQADAYLAWVASKKLTVVRVLVMADALFKLSPQDGERALPGLLDLAQKRGIHVEVVALADTAALKPDIPAHVKAVGEICARYSNTVIELVNEPGHPTQSTLLADPAYLKSLAALIPSGIPVSLGSVEGGDGFAQGSYVTWHAPRSSDWPARIARGAAMVQTYGKPVVNDEPMGAADAPSPGRRDNDPAHFHAAAVASRRAGIGATFHYEGGLQAKRPTAIELACLDAWLQGLSGGR